METNRKVVIVSALLIALFVLLLWSPWVTDEYAVAQVTQFLGDPDAQIEYLGHDVAVKDIPKEVVWTAFGKEVIFPGDCGFCVSLFGIYMMWTV